MIRWSSELVTALAPREVFVFGSNAQGFHGAGSAGLAMRGDARNSWRTDPAFLAAMRAPVGHPDRVGRWAVFGVAHGPQVGYAGQSYAIQTVTRPGARRSVTLDAIGHQLAGLLLYAREHPALTFIVTPVGEGCAGYSPDELDHLWDRLTQSPGLPRNLRFVGRSAGVAMT